MMTKRFLLGALLMGLAAGCADDRDDEYQTRSDVQQRTGLAPYDTADATIDDERREGTVYGREETIERDTGPVYGRSTRSDRMSGAGVRGDRSPGTAPPASSPRDTPMVASPEAREFVTNAASGGLFEVESSQLALERTTDQQERQFAQMMVRDHTAANEELRAIAQRKGITVPRQMEPEHQQMIDRLRSASGTQFRDLYHDLQVQAHDEAIALFERAARELQDSELRRYAERTLPTLREHRDELEQHSHGSPGTGTVPGSSGVNR